MHQNKDLFGNASNQGHFYASHRPNYPVEFYERILTLCPYRQNFLDVATGTGQVLFKLLDHFDGLRVGIDTSKLMLEQAQSVLEKGGYDTKRTILLNASANDPSFREQLDQDIKFDLVTVGQALHWFDVEAFHSLVRDQLLRNDNSVFAVMAYIPSDIDLDLDRINEVQGEALTIGNEITGLFRLFDSLFYQPIKGYFENNQENMVYHYKDYWFRTKYFSRIEFLKKSEPLRFNLDDFILSIKTYSGYNTYIAKNADDPAEKLGNELLLQWEALRVKYSLKLETLPLVFHHEYYMYLMRK